jgi:RND family efflux transporter MFP subunit
MRTFLKCAVGIGLAGIMVGCGKKPEPTLTLQTVEKAVPTVQVKTATATEKDMPQFLRVIGELRSRVDAKVASDGSGKVVEVLVERGSKVKQGDVLIRLDERTAKLTLREAEAQLGQAQAQLGLAQAEYERNAPLAKSKAIADAEFQKMSAELESAKADQAVALTRVDAAQKGLQDLVVKAPFDGVVAERRVSAGEFVGAGTEVVQLVSTGSLRLLLQVSESALGKVKMDQEVTFVVPAYAGQVFVGKVVHLGAVVREATRDLLVEAEVSDEDGRLRQGMFAEGRLAVGLQKRLAIPEAAVKREAGQTKVLVVEDGRMEERLVDLGEAHEGWVEIRNGLVKGTKVVLEPGTDAVDGARIKVAALPSTK